MSPIASTCRKLLAACPPLAVLPEHVRAFAALLTGRQSADLEGWMNAVEVGDLPALHPFVRGLRRDLATVLAGLSMPFNSGPIEDPNTKIKLLKAPDVRTRRLRPAAQVDPAQLTARTTSSVPEPLSQAGPRPRDCKNTV